MLFHPLSYVAEGQETGGGQEEDKRRINDLASQCLDNSILWLVRVCRLTKHLKSVLGLDIAKVS